MKVNKIPVFIPFKENSTRLPGKNFILYPRTIDWLLSEGVVSDDIYVITKSDKVRSFVEMINQDKAIHVHLLDEYPDTVDNIEAGYRAANQLGIPYYIEVPIPQPLREQGLIKKITEQNIEKYDFITTYERISNRNIFFLDDKDDTFVTASDERKGVLCPEQRMIDGSLYLIKVDFLDRYFKNERTKSLNAYFWSGRFKTVENHVPFFIDVDTSEDMFRLDRIIK